VKVLVVDDEAPARSELRHLLGAHPEIEVVGEAGDGHEALAVAQELLPDVILMDIKMGDWDGVTATRRVRNSVPSSRVIVLTNYDEDELVFSSIRAGASGYLLKDTDPARLAHALSGVLSGEAALPRALVARLIKEFRAREHRRRLPLFRERGVELTGREWEVLELLRRGLKTAEIAAELSISPVTVRTHIATVLKKLRVSDRQAAIRLLDGE
jgi:DNA-binding NarL/FixJ family response regulator